MYNFSKTYFYLFLFLTACVTVAGAKTEQPNILWIIAEDCSQDLGCYGNDTVVTPTIDELAANGVKFENVFTAGAVCAPSRTALALGMYQTSVDAHHMRYPDELMNPLPDSVVPMNELFRRGGYVTAHIVDAPANTKLDWSFARSELTGFDFNHWEDLTASEKPFFALVNLKMTHRKFVNDPDHPVSPEDVVVPPYYPYVSVVRRDLADYYETIQILDKQVAQVLEQLEQNDLAENTIVFFFADHGRPFPRAKNSLYDSGTRVPFVAYFPEGVSKPKAFESGSVDDRLLSSIDISATSLALAGVDVPDWMEGQAFYNGTPGFERDYVISCLDRIGGTNFKSRTLRTKDHRLIWNINRDFSHNEASTAYRKQMHPIYHVMEIMKENGQLDESHSTVVDPLPKLELFDLSRDPFEINNLAAEPEYKDTLDELYGMLLDWVKESGDKGMLEDSDAIKEAFAEYRTESHATRIEKIQKLHEFVEFELKSNGEF